MPKLFEFRKLDSKEQMSIAKKVANRSNYELMASAMLTATFFVAVFTIIDIVQNDFANLSVGMIISRILLFWIIGVSIWYAGNVIERRFARRKVEKLKND